MTLLLTNWQSTWRRLGAQTADEALYHALVACYGEPHRAYHTLRHLEECLTHFAALQSFAIHPAELELALWFHDAIYDVKRHDNEARSADWAVACMRQANLDEAAAARVHSLILATRHQVLPSGVDAEILVDVDLSILAAPAPRFDEYERQVREEYRHVPQALFSLKRKQILEEFLARPRIFMTPLFFERHEERARLNLVRSLRRLLG